MLAKHRRLRASEVRDIIAHGRPARANLLSLKFIAAPSPLRAAVVVSKKTAKTAVLRNATRRAVYRALHSIDARGVAVIFVHKIPDVPRTPAFLQELMLLLQKYG
jgi:ribonuclease P protein component